MNKGLRLIAVSVDPPAESAKLKAELGIPFPLLSDLGGKVVAQYGLTHAHGSPEDGDIARPAELILDENGVIRWSAFSEGFMARTRPDAILDAAAQLK